jgi:hypothetical protein
MNQPKGPATPQSKTTMQLAMERSGVGTPPEKIVELRNLKDIARAVRYAAEELQVHLQLGTADTESKKLLIEALSDIVKNIDLARTNSELAASIDVLLKTVSEIDQATTDLLSGAAAQIAELEEEFKQLQSGGRAASPTIAISVVDAELERRARASDEVGAIQEELENERAQLKTELATIKQRIQAGDTSQSTRLRKRDLEMKLAGLEPTIASIIEAISKNDEKVRLLVAYKNAVKLFERGIPSNIIGEKLFDFRSSATKK